MKSIAALLVVFSLATELARAELRLPSIISDHAMPQAGKPMVVWGWAEPGSVVKVEFLRADSSAVGAITATADASGKWSGRLEPLAAGTAGLLNISTDKGSKKVVNEAIRN